MECLICYCNYQNLGPHLRYHKITTAEYRKLFPMCDLVDSETLEQMSKSATGKVKSAEHRRKLSESQLGKVFSEEQRRMISNTLKGNQNALGHHMSEASKQQAAKTLHETLAGDPSIMIKASAKKSETMKALWRDPDYAKRATLNWNKHPNRSEKQLGKILNKHFPNEWRFVGGGEVAIGGHLPDYINTNGKKVVIEMFVLYWHDPETYPERLTEEELIVHYLSYGFTCLVFWEDVVWDDENLIIAKIRSLVEVS